MSNVSMIDGHIDEPKLSYNEKNMALLKKWCDENCKGCEMQSWNERCNGCSVDAVKKLLVQTYIQKTEIERLNKEVERLKEFEYMYNSLLK